MSIFSIIFRLYIITFKNSKINPNFSLRQHYHPCLSGGAFRGRQGSHTLAAAVEGEGVRLPRLSPAGSMMRLGARAGSAGIWDLMSAGPARRGAKNGSPLA